MLVIDRRFPPGAHEAFRLHPQRVGHAVDVIEIGDDLRGVVDGAVIPALRAQRLDITLAHRAGVSREALSEFAKRPLGRA